MTEQKLNKQCTQGMLACLDKTYNEATHRTARWPTGNARAPYVQNSGGSDTTSVIYNDHCLTTEVSSSSTAAESILTPATRTKRLAINDITQ